MRRSARLEKIEWHTWVISSYEGVSVDPDKIRAILEWPTPINLELLRGFLGLRGYYRRCVKNYAIIASPLTEQLKKDNFNWDGRATEAFEKLKLVMTTTPVMRLPNFQEPFVMEADASGYGLGAVLRQNSHPIAYYSKILGPRGQVKSIYGKE